MTVWAVEQNNDPPAIAAPTGLEFQITDTKLYVPIVKRKWQETFEQLTQMIVQSNNNNLNYLIDLS